MTQEPAPDWATRLAQTIAGEVRRHRQRRKMSAQQLSDRCAELGMPIQRSVLANLESGRRTTVNVAEVLVLAAALDVPPAQLIFPVGQGPVVEILPGDKRQPLFGIDWISGFKTLSDRAAKESKRNPVTLAREHDELAQGVMRARRMHAGTTARLAEFAKYERAAHEFDEVQEETAALHSEIDGLDTSTEDGVQLGTRLRKQVIALHGRLASLSSEANLYKQARRNAEQSVAMLASYEERLKAFRKGMRRAGWEPPLLPVDLSYIEPGAPTVDDLEKLPVLSDGGSSAGSTSAGIVEEEAADPVADEDLMQAQQLPEGLLMEDFAALVADAVAERLARRGLPDPEHSSDS